MSYDAQKTNETISCRVFGTYLSLGSHSMGGLFKKNMIPCVMRTNDYALIFQWSKTGFLAHVVMALEPEIIVSGC